MAAEAEAGAGGAAGYRDDKPGNTGDTKPAAGREGTLTETRQTPLSLQLRAVLPNYSVELFTFAIGVRAHTCTPAQMHTHTHTYAHTRIRTPTRTYARAHTHTHKGGSPQ